MEQVSDDLADAVSGEGLEEQSISSHERLEESRRRLSFLNMPLHFDSIFHFSADASIVGAAEERLLNPVADQVDDLLTDEDLEKVREMQEANAQVLARMTALMSSMGKHGKAKVVAKKVDAGPLFEIKKPPREDYGVDVNKLKKWVTTRNNKLLEEEEYRQEIAVAKVHGFLNAIRMITKLQAWWRMMMFRIEFRQFREERKYIKARYYVAWKRHWRAEKMHVNQILGKPFRAWADETLDSKRLKTMVRDFFAICIKRLRLTPQAIMAFFSPGEWMEGGISEIDSMKIRRLILNKLFRGWRSETRELRGMRFKATQILARTMRRSKGPLWVKEGVLVCFHIWHRYSAVRKAYKKDEPDPQFKNPYLPQWAKLLSDITLSRIHRKRAQEKGELLTLKRNFRMWRFVMTLDRSKLMTPMAIAINHHTEKVHRKVMNAWSGILKERGSIMRIRDKCFAAWKKWAPRNRKLKRLKRTTIGWLKERNTKKVFEVMTSKCFNVVGQRAATLRMLRQGICDRKIMTCAFALANRDANVIMLDCWRRWQQWWQNRCRWRTSLWHYRFMWFQNKAKAVFGAWKSLVALRLPVTIENNASTIKSNTNNGAFIAFSNVASVPYPVLFSTAMNDCLTHFDNAQNDIYEDAPTDEAFNLFCQAVRLSYSKQLAKLAKAKKHQLEQEALKAHKQHERNELRLQKQEREEDGADDVSQGGNSIKSAAKSVGTRGSEEGGAKEEGEDDGEEDEESMAQGGDGSHVDQLSEDGDHSVAAAPTLSREEMQEAEEVRLQLELQDKLQRGIDALDMRLVSLAVEEGAIIESKHVQQVAKHFGDVHMPLFNMLLSGSVDFVLQRVISGDKTVQLMTCSNPFNAILLSSHIDRWERKDLTTREMRTLTDDSILSASFGSNYQSVILWRAVVIMLVRKREEELRNKCIILPTTRTMEQEVAETMKRKKLARVVEIRKNLMNMIVSIPASFLDGMENTATTLSSTTINIGDNHDQEDNQELPSTEEDLPSSLDEHQNTDEIPPLIGTPKEKAPISLDWAKNMDIYSLLHEYTRMTGTFTKEARALREPLLKRDDLLLEKAFMAQARRNFLDLRAMCMKPEEKLAKAQKAEEKLQKKKHQAKVERRKMEAQLRAKYSHLLEPKEADEEGGVSVKGKKKGKKSKKKGGKNKHHVEEEEVEAADVDENDELLIKFDPLNFDESFLAGLLSGPSDVREEIEEIDFASRTSPFVNVLIETWKQRAKRGQKEVRILLASRACAGASSVSRRVFKFVKDGGMEQYIEPSTMEIHAGLSRWLVSQVLNDTSLLILNIFSWLPPEWWDFHAMQSRAKFESVAMDAIIHKMTHHTEKNLDATQSILAKKHSLEDYLKENRLDILRIGEKQSEKVIEDMAARASKARIALSYEKKIADLEKKIKVLNDALVRAEAMIASTSYEAALIALGGSITDEDKLLPDWAENIHFRSFALVEEKKAEIVQIEESIAELKEARRTSDSELKLFDKLCARSSTWLRNMAEARFNLVLNVQEIIQSLSHDKAIKDRDGMVELRSLSVFEKNGAELHEFNLLLEKQRLRLEAEAEERIRLSQQRPRAQSREVVSRKRGDSRHKRKTDSRSSFELSSAESLFGDSDSRLSSREQDTKTFSRGNTLSGYSPRMEAMSKEDYEPLDALAYAGAPSGIEPRKLTVEEEIILATGGESAAVVPTFTDTLSSTVDAAASITSISSAQLAKDDAELRLSVKKAEELERAQLRAVKLVEMEQAAMLVAHELRGKVFDDYWDLVVPVRLGSKRSTRDEVNTARSSKDGGGGSYFSEEGDSALAASPGKTTRMWIKLGDEFLEKKWNGTFEKRTMELGAEPSISSSLDDESVAAPAPPLLPSEIDINVEAWRMPKTYVNSISMRKEEEAEEDLGAAASPKATKGTQDDPFIVVGRLEIQRLKATVIHKMQQESKEEDARSKEKADKAPALDFETYIVQSILNHKKSQEPSVDHHDTSVVGGDETLASLSYIDEQSSVEEVHYEREERLRKEPEMRIGFGNESDEASTHLPASISDSVSLNSDAMHQRKAEELMAMLEKEEHPLDAEWQYREEDSEHQHHQVIDVVPSEEEGEAGMTSAAAGDREVKALHQKHYIPEEEDDNTSDISMEDTAAMQAAHQASQRKRMSQAQIASMGEHDSASDGEDNDRNSRSPKPISFVSVNSQPSTANAPGTSKFSRKGAKSSHSQKSSGGAGAVGGKAPMVMERADDMLANGTNLEMHSVSAQQIAEMTEAQAPIAHLKPKRLIKRAKVVEEGVAVLAGGKWSLQPNPTKKGSRKAKEDFIVSGKAMRSQTTASNPFAFLLSSDMADVLSTSSYQRLASRLGFTDEPFFEDNGDSPVAFEQSHTQSVVTYGSLLEMVEAELSMPSSTSNKSSGLKKKVGKSSRGVLAKQQPLQSKVAAFPSKAPPLSAATINEESSGKHGSDGGNEGGRGGRRDRDAQVEPNWMPSSQKVVTGAGATDAAARFSNGDNVVEYSEGEEENKDEHFSTSWSNKVDDADPLEIVGKRRERLSTLTMVMFAENVRTLLLEQQRVQEEKLRVNPLLHCDVGTTNLVLKETAKRRKEQRDYIAEGMRIIEEEQSTRSGSLSLSISGQKSEIRGANSLELSGEAQVVVNGAKHLDFDMAFGGALADHTRMEKTRSDSALLRQQALQHSSLIGRGFFYAGTDAVTGSDSPFVANNNINKTAPSSPQAEGSLPPPGSSNMSQTRKNRLMDLQKAYFRLLEDDDEALEIAYATVLGLSEKWSVSPPTTAPEKEDGEKVIETFPSAGNKNGFLAKREDVVFSDDLSLDTSFNDEGEDEEEEDERDVSVAEEKNFLSSFMGGRHSPAQSWIADPFLRPGSASSADLLFVEIARKKTPVMSMRDFKAARMTNKDESVVDEATSSTSPQQQQQLEQQQQQQQQQQQLAEAEEAKSFMPSSINAPLSIEGQAAVFETKPGSFQPSKPQHSVANPKVMQFTSFPPAAVIPLQPLTIAKGTGEGGGGGWGGGVEEKNKSLASLSNLLAGPKQEDEEDLEEELRAMLGGGGGRAKAGGGGKSIMRTNNLLTSSVDRYADMERERIVLSKRSTQATNSSSVSSIKRLGGGLLKPTLTSTPLEHSSDVLLSSLNVQLLSAKRAKQLTSQVSASFDSLVSNVDLVKNIDKQLLAMSQARPNSKKLKALTKIPSVVMSNEARDKNQSR